MNLLTHPAMWTLRLSAHSFSKLVHAFSLNSLIVWLDVKEVERNPSNEHQAKSEGNIHVGEFHNENVHHGREKVTAIEGSNHRKPECCDYESECYHGMLLNKVSEMIIQNLKNIHDCTPNTLWVGSAEISTLSRAIFLPVMRIPSLTSMKSSIDAQCGQVAA